MSAGEIAIRPYQEADRAGVVELWRACGLSRPWNPPDGDIDFVQSSGHGELLVATDPGRVVATVMVGHDGHRGWVYYLAVDPQRQKRGIGARLMGAAEAWLVARQVRKVELMIRSTNRPVAEFYGALGYAEEPVLVMSRWLDGTER